MPPDDTKASAQHVVIVMSHPWPANNSVANRVSSFVTPLSQRARVTVVSPKGSGPAPKAVEQHEVASTRENAARRVLGRAYEEIRQTVLLIRAMRAYGDGAIVVLTIPSIFLLAGAFFARGPVIIDIRDLVWEYIPKETRLGPLIAPIVRAFARLALGRSRTLFVTNPSEQEHLKAHFGLASTIVPNGVEAARLQRLQALADPEPDVQRAMRMLYLGNVGFAQRLPALVDAVSGMKGVELDIVGSGNDSERVRTQCRTHGTSNVRLHGDVDREAALRWYERADVLVAQLGPAFDYAVPSKLYEYLATGRPILYIGAGSAIRLLAGFEGVVISRSWAPADIRAAMESVRKLVGQSFLAQRRQRLSREFTREVAAAAFVEAVMIVVRSLPSKS